MKAVFLSFGLYFIWAVFMSAIAWNPILAAWIALGVILFYVWLLIKSILKHFGIIVPHLHRWKKRAYSDEYDIFICTRCAQTHKVEKDA